MNSIAGSDTGDTYSTLQIMIADTKSIITHFRKKDEDDNGASGIALVFFIGLSWRC